MESEGDKKKKIGKRDPREGDWAREKRELGS